MPAASNRAIGEAIQAFEREIVIYRDLGERFRVPMPRYYYAALDPNPAAWMERGVLFLFEKLPVRAVNWLLLRFISLSGKSKRRYLLIIEDITDARAPSQVEGGSTDDAKAALELLAKFHAHNWMSEEAAGVSSLIRPTDQTPKVWQASYIRNRAEFLASFGEFVTAETMAKLDGAQTNMSDLVGQLAAPPWTITHGDYRLDNILYRPDGELVVLDFQMVSKGRAGWDVAYFITTALTPDLRSEEETLLRRYHETLVTAGISDYSYDTLVADVETSKLVLAHRFVCVTDNLDTAMEGRDETFIRILVERIVGWIE